MKSMKKKNHILQGVTILLVSQILIKVIGLIYKLYLTNKDGFGDIGNAIYSSGFQIYALFLTLSSTGVPNALSKLVSERLALGDTRGAYKIFKISFIIFAIIGMSCCILLFLGAEFIANVLIQIPETKYSLMVLAPSIFFVSITSVIRGYFNGMENVSITAKSQTVEQLSKTVLTIILVEIVSKFIITNAVIMASVANAATTLATILSFIYVYISYINKRKEIGNEIKQSVNNENLGIKGNLKKILNATIPISLSSLIASFNKNIDSFTIVRFLKHLISEEQAIAQYGILTGKVDILTMLPLSLNIPFVTVLVPEISKANIKKNNKEIEKKSKFFIMISIIIGLPMTAGIFVYADQILKLLFPNASDGVMLLKFSSFTIIFSLIGQTINAILQGIGKEKVPLFSFVVGMIAKFFCNVFLIKYIGIIGAIIGNIICNFIVCLIGVLKLKKYIHIKFEIKNFIIKPILATFLMIFISIFTYNNLISIISLKLATILSIIVAIIVYFISLNLLKIMPKAIFLIKK